MADRPSRLEIHIGRYTLYGYHVNYPEGVSVKEPAPEKFLAALRRIEGQVRGIGKMIEGDRYCVDIVTQIEAARAALARVEADLLRRHLQHCVHAAMTSDDEGERERVIEELVGLFRRS